ncbi:MAG: PA2928 family protein [Microscillaceae bacterium]|nr:PA2928 family protein [Microscillaceae bacterium]
MRRHHWILNFGTLCLMLGLSACSEWSVNKIILVTDTQKKALVALEERYTVTSSSSGGGISHRSGYTNFFLKTYNPETGKKLKSIKVGDSKDRAVFIAQTGKKLWFYSNYKKQGLHSRDALTLDILENQKQILAKNPSWGDEFISGTFNTDSYYQYDPSNGMIVFTSASGQLYSLDPQKITIQALSEKPKSLITSCYSNQAWMKDSLQFSFEGNPRSHLMIDKVFLQLRYDKINEAFNAQEEKRRVFLDNLYKQNEANTISSPDYIRIRDSVYQVQRTVQDSVYKLRDTYSYGGKNKEVYPKISFLNPYFLIKPGFFEAQVLSIESGEMIFVLSDSKIGDGKVFQITGIALHPSVSALWTTQLEDLHEDTRSTGDLTSVDIQDIYLYVAFKKDLICLDMRNGQIKWRKQYD